MLRIIVLSLFVASGLCATPSLPFRRHNGPLYGPNPKILDGTNAEEGQYPYMVSLNYVGDGHACGASILTRNWVLTAAHCCLTGYDLEVEAGSIYLSSNQVQVHRINQYVVNPNYDPNQNWINDACLIQIADDFQFNDRVQQVTLPAQDFPVNDGEKVTITGWGYTTADSNQQVVPDRLQVGKDFNALSNDHCGQVTGQNMHGSYVCAQGNHEGQGVCNGDSGSPLMKNGVQVGIASWVFLPCGSGLPDFYSRVPYHIPWIQQVLGTQAKELKFAHTPLTVV